MFPLKAALLATFALAFSPCHGQTPRDVAWAAYTATRQGHREMIPPPEAAAIGAVADALIQLEAKLPANAIMHLYP